jgi:hypothetical protein
MAVVWFARESKIAALEGMEFRRSGFYAEFLCDNTPSFVPVCLVCLYDHFGLLIGHLAQLKDHKGIGRGSNYLQDFVYPRNRDAELRA